MYVNEKTFDRHPETTETQKEMDAYLFLEENGVEYIRAEHDEAATIELCESVEKIIDAKIFFSLTDNRQYFTCCSLKVIWFSKQNICLLK